jgi:hypothetical protein
MGIRYTTVKRQLARVKKAYLCTKVLNNPGSFFSQESAVGTLP